MGNTKGAVDEQFVSEPKAPRPTAYQRQMQALWTCGHSLVQQANRITGHLEKCHPESTVFGQKETYRYHRECQEMWTDGATKGLTMILWQC